MIEKHYKTREVADLLGIHPDTIRRAVQRGELESIRIGLDRIYAESAVHRWLEGNREHVRTSLHALSPQTRRTSARTRA